MWFLRRTFRCGDVALLLALLGVSLRAQQPVAAPTGAHLSRQVGAAVASYPKSPSGSRVMLISDPGDGGPSKLLVVDAESGAVQRRIHTPDYGSWICVGSDADRDGFDDIVLGGSNGGAACYSFRSGRALFGFDASMPVAALREDVDGDGVEDLVALHRSDVRLASGSDGHTLCSFGLAIGDVAVACAVDPRSSGARPARILVTCVHLNRRPDGIGRIVVLSTKLEVVAQIDDPITFSHGPPTRPARFGQALCVVPGAGNDGRASWFVGAPNDYDDTRPFEGLERVRVSRVDPQDALAVPFHFDGSGGAGRVLCVGPDVDGDERLDLLVADPDYHVVAGRVLLISSADGRVLRTFGPYENPQPKGGYDESELRTGTSMACSLGEGDARSILVLGCRPLTDETRAIVRAVDVRTNELLWTLEADR